MSQPEPDGSGVAVSNEMTSSALTPELPHQIAAAVPGVIVLGDAVLDVWLAGTSHRLCREAPVPVIEVSNRSSAPGGAANTAVNLAAMGGDISLVSVAGDDPEGETLRGRVSRGSTCSAPAATTC